MCGKFTQMATWKGLVAFSQPLTVPSDRLSVTIATPMRFANIMRLNATCDREMMPMRWGFAGKKDGVPFQPKHMHARCETIDSRPTFKQAFEHGRGILFVHTFNEGEELPNGKTKQWVITPKGAKPIAIAGICEKWRNGAETLQTFSQVTTPANQLISRITDRMPAILEQDDWATWLGETDASSDDIKGILKTFDDRGTWTMAEQARSRRAKPQQPNTQQGLL